MRMVGLTLASFGGAALAYVGVTMLGDMLLPPTTATDSTRLLIVAGVGGLVTAFGLSLAVRSS